MRTAWPCILAALVVLAAWLPGLPPYWVTLADTIGIAAVLATGLVVLTGFAGITSLGQASLMGFGAYAAALADARLGLNPWLGLPLALLAAGLAAWLIGLITLRLSGHYLAVGTIAWSVSLYFVFVNLAFLGRNDGISGLPPLRVAGWALTGSAALAPVVWGMLALVLVATARLLNSRSGRALRAMRGGARAAAAFGIVPARMRLLAFVYAGMLAGLAGWLFVQMQRSVNPTPFDLTASIEYLLMAVIGGVATLQGAILGAAIVTLLHDQLQDLLPLLLGQGGSSETIVFGVLLVAVLQAAPQGLWPLIWRRRRITHHAASIAPPAGRARPAPGTLVLQGMGLGRRFGGLRAVQGMDIALHTGEIIGLIGPNGAGKSTLFNLLTGADAPTEGRLVLPPREFARLLPQQAAAAGIARSFQHVKLVPGMSVIENVALGAHRHGRAGPLAAVLRTDRAEEAALFAAAQARLAQIGLHALADRPAGSLALGQQRLVEIARALCLEPSLLLLDEPAAGLRHAEKQALAALLRALRQDGMGILLVEHDMGFVMGLVDRLVVMAEGAPLAAGSPADIRADPRVVAAYLGTA